MTSSALNPRAKIIASLIALAAASMIPARTDGRERFVPHISHKQGWRERKGWNVYHHTMITSTAAEITAWNRAVAKKRLDKLHMQKRYKQSVRESRYSSNYV